MTDTHVPNDRHRDVVEGARGVRSWARERLEDLVRIPSISADGHDADEVRRSAEATASVLREAGFEQARLLELAGAHPYVFGEISVDTSAPTVLLYAHHDVQPVPTADRWGTPPFDPTERGGRLYGRGTADDKAGVMVHAAAVRTWMEARGGPPMNVKVIIEGEEEIGSPHLREFLERHAEDLRADVVVATDLVNWKVGVPGITYALRGLAEVYVTVRALEQPVHSGMWGGAVPDALTGLIRALASLTDADGSAAIPGLGDDIRAPSEEERGRIAELDADPDELRHEVRMLEGVEFVGDAELPLLERIWMRPTVNVIGIDVPDVRSAANTLLAEARAKVSVRLAPGQDPDRAARVVAEHLERNVPWGLHVETRPGNGGEAWIADPEGPAFAAARAALGAAFGTDPVLLGCGGSIPFVSPIQESLDAPCLLTGIEDPASNAHGEDESLHLEDFARACLGEALLFDELSRRIQAEGG